MEQQPQPGSTAVGRGQNVVHVLPTDWAVAPGALAPLLDRLDSDAGGVQLMVVVADADAAVAVVNALVRSRGPVSLRAVAATGASRTARILRAGAAPVLVGAPDQLVALLRASALKLEGLRGFAVAWIEDVLESGGGPDLEAVMAELPKDVPRTVITSSASPEVEDFVERYARRAPRIGPPVPAPAGIAGGGAALDVGSRVARAERVADGPAGSESPLAYVLVTPAGRAKALERVLDEVDPPSAAIYVRTDDSEQTVRETLRALGYAGDAAVVRVVRGPVTEHTALLLLYDLPYDADELRRAAGGEPGRTMALLHPRQLRHLRSVTAEPVLPFVFAAPTTAARAREDSLRAELRRELVAGAPAREVLTLEPLLAEYDGVALAAAALRILERMRVAAAAAKPVAPREPVGPRPLAPSRPADRGRDATPRGARDSGGRPGPRSERDGRGPRPAVGARAPQRDRGPSRPDTRPLPRQPR